MEASAGKKVKQFQEIFGRLLSLEAKSDYSKYLNVNIFSNIAFNR